MLNTLKTTALAATLAVTGFATPAQASDESDTIAALIFGAAALWAVIEATDDDPKPSPAPETHTHNDEPRTHKHHWGVRHRHAHAHDGHTHNDRHGHGESADNKHSDKHGRKHGDKHTSNKNNSNVLPGQCQRATSGKKADSRDKHTYFSSKCLAKNDAEAGLPSSCEKVYYTNNGRRDGYATTCLLRNGYVIGRN